MADSNGQQLNSPVIPDMGCQGDGRCLIQTDSENEYESNECPFACVPQKCPNFDLCRDLLPKWVLIINGGLCMGCAISFDEPLKITTEEYECPICMETVARKVKMVPCRHELCISCFHWGKPGIAILDGEIDEQFEQRYDAWEASNDAEMSAKCPMCRAVTVPNWWKKESNAAVSE